MRGNLSRHAMTLRSAMNCWKRWQGASGRGFTPTRIILAAGFCITLKSSVFLFCGILFGANCSNDKQNSGAGKSSKDWALAGLFLYRQRECPWDRHPPSLHAFTRNRMLKQLCIAALSCMETLHMTSKRRLLSSAPSPKLNLKRPKTPPSVANKFIQQR